MCILSTLFALNSIENYKCQIEFRMDSMHIGTQAETFGSFSYCNEVHILNTKTKLNALSPQHLYGMRPYSIVENESRTFGKSFWNSEIFHRKWEFFYSSSWCCICGTQNMNMRILNKANILFLTWERKWPTWMCRASANVSYFYLYKKTAK